MIVGFFEECCSSASRDIFHGGQKVVSPYSDIVGVLASRQVRYGRTSDMELGKVALGIDMEHKYFRRRLGNVRQNPSYETLLKNDKKIQYCRRISRGKHVPKTVELDI